MSREVHVEGGQETTAIPVEIAPSPIARVGPAGTPEPHHLTGDRSLPVPGKRLQASVSFQESPRVLGGQATYLVAAESDNVA